MIEIAILALLLGVGVFILYRTMGKSQVATQAAIAKPKEKTEEEKLAAKLEEELQRKQILTKLKLPASFPDVAIYFGS